MYSRGAETLVTISELSRYTLYSDNVQLRCRNEVVIFLTLHINEEGSKKYYKNFLHHFTCFFIKDTQFCEQLYWMLRATKLSSTTVSPILEMWPSNFMCHSLPADSRHLCDTQLHVAA
jgi:hypothetical protein